MKVLTANFLTCAVKKCKESPLSFPLHFSDATLARQDMEYSPAFLRGILARVDWPALRTTATELGFTTLPEEKPELPLEPLAGDEEDKEPSASETDTAMQTDDGKGAPSQDEQEKLLRDLHTLLMETTVEEGQLVCGNCGHQYRIKEGIANFLLPNHLV